MSTLPDWMIPPRPEGWFAADLDDLPDAPRHTELIDGSLIFTMSPQRRWHMEVVDALRSALRAQAPENYRVDREMTVVLDERNRPEPDVIVSTSPFKGDQTWIPAETVELVVEVVSPESAERDRHMKPPKYAAAGIRSMWLVDDEDGAPVVSVYELDATTGAYTRTQVARGSLRTPLPFDVEIDLATLTP